MILHNGGKYIENKTELPKREVKGSVEFKEIKDTGKLGLITNIGTIIVVIVLLIPFVIIGKDYFKGKEYQLLLALIFSGLALPIHELLHAICFKKDVYFYNNLSQGLVFVTGTEDMSKLRFVCMCLLPNIILGVIPYLTFLINNNFIFCGLFGLLCIGTGFGDYLNVFHAITQMPKGAKTYLSGKQSYWYLDK